MADISDPLERKFLVKNLQKDPESDEEGPKARIEIDSDFSESEEDTPFSKQPEPPVDPNQDWGNLLNKNRSKHNTGPKGVKADYEEARRIIRRQNETKVLQAQEIFKHAAYGSTTTEASVSYSSMKQYNDFAKEYQEIDVILNETRLKRLQEFRDLSSLPKFGKVFEVSKFEFLEHIETSDPRTFVVIHLYEDYIQSCVRLNQILDSLSIKLSYIKFLKLKATEADQTLSHSALPAIMVYQNNQLVNDVEIKLQQTLFNKVIGTSNTNNDIQKFSEEDFEFFLASKYGIKIPGLDLTDKEKDISGLKGIGEKVRYSEGERSEYEYSGYVGTDSIKNKMRQKEEEEEDDGWS